MKNKLITAAAAVLLCGGLLVGWGSGEQKSAEPAADAASEKIEVVCTTFPAYDWVMQVVGDQAANYEITYLMDSGVDLHSYQPSVEDVAKITDADLFVYVGGESDEWASDIIASSGGPDLHTVSMLEAVGDAAVEEEIVEGMHADEHEHEHEEGEAAEDEDHEHEEDEDHEHEEGEDHEHEEGPEYDEHVWLSLKNAQTLVNAIAGELSEVDAENAAVYTANASAYCAKLAELDASYADVVKAASKSVVIFADRFPFRYLVDDYGLTYYAAFVGCSAETEASFETVAFLAQKVDELEAKSVLVIENSDQTIAQTVIQNTKTKDQTILVMDSLQSTTDAEVAEGKSYLGTMEQNLVVLTTALS